MNTSAFPILTQIACKRDHVSTREYAASIKRSPQTIRKEHCLKGEAYGIRPKKVGNTLLWPIAEIFKLLGGDPNQILASNKSQKKKNPSITTITINNFKRFESSDLNRKTRAKKLPRAIKKITHAIRQRLIQF